MVEGAAIRIQAPTVLPVDLRVAAKNLEIDGTDSDAKIAGWLRGITKTLEQRIRQCLMRQVWRIRLPGFCPEIELPHPVIEVLEIEYLDPQGETYELPVSAVRLIRGEYATHMLPARGTRWPATMRDEEGVWITVACGYGDAPEDIPEDLHSYLLAKLVEQYDPAAGGERVTVQTSYIDGMLDHYRSFR